MNDLRQSPIWHKKVKKKMDNEALLIDEKKIIIIQTVFYRYSSVRKIVICTLLKMVKKKIFHEIRIFLSQNEKLCYIIHHFQKYHDQVFSKLFPWVKFFSWLQFLKFTKKIHLWTKQISANCGERMFTLQKWILKTLCDV